MLLAAPVARAQAPTAGGLAAGDTQKPVSIEADKGIEWQQANHVYIARGHAKATRGDTTVYADTLYAYYRPAKSTAAPKNGGDSAASAPKPATAGAFGDGSTEIYRLEADGNVRLATPTQTVYGDHAVYDVDKAMLVVTGKDLRLVTPRDTVTARDSLEWYDRKQLAVARGDAVAVREGKRVRGDVLTAQVEKPPNGSSHISRINAQGHVLVASQDEIARGDKGVYNLDTGIATLMGNVTLTKGDNELRGQYAVVDLNRNVGHLLSVPPSAKFTGAHPPRVEGLFVPHKKSGAGTQ
jgi:lipopolysaccharide export system protein LptA